MELTLRKAAHYPTVRDFYDTLIDRMQESEYHPKWQKGIYPEYEALRQAVTRGQLYLAYAGEEPVGAMILNQHANPEYDLADWAIPAGREEVTVIHTLGVMPHAGRQGVGSFLVEQALDIARREGRKALRLDVLQGNLPAERLYQKAGFRFVQSMELFYEDTGRCGFDLYEYVL